MGQKLFIGGLPFSTSTDELGELLKQVPGVENVAIVTDRDTGQSRGFGFVEMATSEAADQAVQEVQRHDARWSHVDGRDRQAVRAAQRRRPSPGRWLRPELVVGGPRVGAARAAPPHATVSGSRSFGRAARFNPTPPKSAQPAMTMYAAYAAASRTDGRAR